MDKVSGVLPAGRTPTIASFTYGYLLRRFL